MTDRELMKMARRALELRCNDADGNEVDLVTPAIKALRDRLAQPEPPDVIWLTFHEPPMVFRDREDALAFCQDGEQPIPMYSSPVAQPEPEPVVWVENLTDPQPHAVTDLKYCSVAQHESGEYLKYIPLYTAPPNHEVRKQREGMAQPNRGSVGFQEAKLMEKNNG